MIGKGKVNLARIATDALCEEIVMGRLPPGTPCASRACRRDLPCRPPARGLAVAGHERL